VSALRVSIDATAIPVDAAGAGRYCLEIVRALSQRDDVDLAVLARSDDADRWLALGAAAVDPVAPRSRLGRIVYEKTLMGSAIKRLGVAAHHGPHYTLPARCPVPGIVTIHDMTFFERPEVHESAKVAFFTRAIAHAAATASAIICVSAWTADRLEEHVTVTAPVFVAPHGVDHERFRPEEASPGADHALLAGIGLGDSRTRIVTLGTLEPRKGVIDLIQAFDALAATDPSLELVLAGQRGWGMSTIDAALERCAARDRIRILGYVEDAAVPALLRSAAVVAYPSIDEGFGLPALEALACGAKLVTTEDSVMAQVCGSAPWYTPSGSPTALAAALAAALKASPHEGDERRCLGTTAAAGFTWSAAAAVHAEAYAVAAGSSSNRHT
jgi:glycosyltransferase involved in cell wall biosynthesis